MAERTHNYEWLKPHQFKPGCVANPYGARPIPPEIRQLKLEKSNEYQKKFLYWLDAPKDDLKKCTNAPWEITAMDLSICSAISQSINGNYKAFQFILERLFGKAVQSVELSGNDGQPILVNSKYSQLSLDELKQLATKAMGEPS